MVNIDLLGKRAVVTGGSRGVGRAIARLLAQAGAQVGISYRARHDEAGMLVRELEQAGVSAGGPP
ncbi:MAG: SDR family NAD(P)-dependent oxidoreductase, partial [Gemmatimonadota bacterium]